MSPSTTCSCPRPPGQSLKPASKIGSSTIFAAICATRSRAVGIPNGRFRPSCFGMSCRRTGCDRYRPSRRSCSMPPKNSATPCARCRRGSPRRSRRLPDSPTWAALGRREPLALELSHSAVFRKIGPHRTVPPYRYDEPLGLPPDARPLHTRRIGPALARREPPGRVSPFPCRTVDACHRLDPGGVLHRSGSRGGRLLPSPRHDRLGHPSQESLDPLRALDRPLRPTDLSVNPDSATRRSGAHRGGTSDRKHDTTSRMRHGTQSSAPRGAGCGAIRWPRWVQRSGRRPMSGRVRQMRHAPLASPGSPTATRSSNRPDSSIAFW